MFALKLAETGGPRFIGKLGIIEATFYNWKKKYSGLGHADSSPTVNLKQVRYDLLHSPPTGATVSGGCTS